LQQQRVVVEPAVGSGYVGTLGNARESMSLNFATIVTANHAKRRPARYLAMILPVLLKIAFLAFGLRGPHALFHVGEATQLAREPLVRAVFKFAVPCCD